MHDYLPIIERDGFYTCASGGLGHGLPAAVGVALGRPDAKVIAILGDGSSMYSIQGLWSAAQLGLKIAFIIVKNGRYEALHEFGRHFDLAQLPGTALPQLDFCGLATAQGMRAIRVERPADLAAALGEAFRFRESILIEVIVDGGMTA
jgi:benzoylformate decarboxylase